MFQQNIYVAADALVFCKTGNDLYLLLIKRGNDPFKGMWAFPGGFVDEHEELEAAAIRELHEETGLKVESMTQLHTFGKVGRDSRFRTVSVVYYAFVDQMDTSVNGGDDAAHAEWVNVKDITSLAFDHKECLDLALNQLGLKAWPIMLS